MKKLALIIPLLLSGCGDEISLVKAQSVEAEEGTSYRYGVILDERALCEKTDWMTYEKNAAKYVEYNCLLKQGDILSTYSEEGEKKFSQEVKEKSIKAQKEFFERRLTSLANGNEVLTNIVNTFEERLADERKNAGYWRTDNILMGDFLVSYSKTLEGDKVFRSLSSFGWNPIKTKYDPVKVFNEAIKSGTQEDMLILKSILQAVLPDYLEKVNGLIKDTELASKDDEKIEKRAIKQAEKATIKYRESHPVSRKEVLVWTWNKLDESYLLLDSYREVKLIDGSTQKQKLSVQDIKFSVSHNLNELDEYLGDEFQEINSTGFSFS